MTFGLYRQELLFGFPHLQQLSLRANWKSGTSCWNLILWINYIIVSFALQYRNSMQLHIFNAIRLRRGCHFDGCALHAWCILFVMNSKNTVRAVKGHLLDSLLICEMVTCLVKVMIMVAGRVAWAAGCFISKGSGRAAATVRHSLVHILGNIVFHLWFSAPSMWSPIVPDTMAVLLENLFLVLKDLPTNYWTGLRRMTFKTI